MTVASSDMLDDCFVPAVQQLESNRRYLEHLTVAERDPSVIRLASNENLYPPPPAVVEAVARAVRSANLYPHTDPPLRHRLAERHGVSADQILIGAGAGEVIDATIRAFATHGDKVVMPVPTWPVYKKRLVAAGASAREVPIRLEGSSYRHDTAEIAAAICSRTKLVILCSPNNPTGNLIDRHQLASIASTGRPLLVDSAYDDFAARADHLDEVAAGKLVAEHPNVLVARTFSKSYALAGIRLGYLLGDPTVLERIERLLLPGSSVSSLALAAGAAALDEEDYREAHVGKVISERDRVTEGLRALGLDAHDSWANFVPVTTGTFPGGASGFVAELRNRKIAVRSMSDTLVRITVGREHENDALLGAVRGSLRDTPAR